MGLQYMYMKLSIAIILAIVVVATIVISYSMVPGSQSVDFRSSVNTLTNSVKQLNNNVTSLSERVDRLESQPAIVESKPGGITAMTDSGMEFMNSSYSKDTGVVYYTFDDIKNPIAGADAATFIALGVCRRVETSYSYYAKDKDRVYCGDTVIEGADAATFEFVGLFDENPGGMPTTSGIAKDKNCIYRGGKKVTDANGVCINPEKCSLSSDVNFCGVSI